MAYPCILLGAKDPDLPSNVFIQIVFQSVEFLREFPELLVEWSLFLSKLLHYLYWWLAVSLTDHQLPQWRDRLEGFGKILTIPVDVGGGVFYLCSKLVVFCFEFTDALLQSFILRFQRLNSILESGFQLCESRFDVTAILCVAIFRGRCVGQFRYLVCTHCCGWCQM
ncbi:hypothetical protein D3D02_15995 [Halobellus sp. Atlit-38R]|nr:hypothetical protein D3D02_15995 [Halobellus sp. Atlit-38R]